MLARCLGDVGGRLNASPPPTSCLAYQRVIQIEWLVPQVDTVAFPDMRAMTAKARALGVVPGWYGNNCHCAEHRCSGLECFQGDVQATLDYGFRSIKLDGCGVEKNITLYSVRALPAVCLLITSSFGRNCQDHI